MKLLYTFLPSLAVLAAITTSFDQHEPKSNNLKPEPELRSNISPTETLVKPLAATEQKLVVTMKRVFRPLFDNLKQEIGTQSKSDDVDFKAVSRDSLMVAELMARIHQWPDIAKFESEKSRTKYVENQKELATEETQADAVAIYKAANDKNFELAKKHFVSMTKNCNICHVKKKVSWVPVALKP